MTCNGDFVIYGKEAVFCPSAAGCYCNLYGLCNLTCSEIGCRGQYDLPKYSTLPRSGQKSVGLGRRGIPLVQTEPSRRSGLLVSKVLSRWPGPAWASSAARPAAYSPYE
ncbi:hypothetical protein N657DRAFT_646353 [Parathielavia appendiculata]|uniref:Uncharacterized protein n=1 Tax=Parathielavia appendiculata TaxID=2587402 RepID=A0AAN6TXK8_9PEZI|nr:hypothetical protein N657DRAFT_646353 [Parathielavia appendiculata]